VIALLLKWLGIRPERHYPSKWDGTHATCKCGYHSVWDWNLRKHFEQTGRIGS